MKAEKQMITNSITSVMASTYKRTPASQTFGSRLPVKKAAPKATAPSGLQALFTGLKVILRKLSN